MTAFFGEIREWCAFMVQLLADRLRRARKPRARLRRAALIAREDLFPVNHGAAVKIVQTAKHLSMAYDEVLVITQSRMTYHVFRRGEASDETYPLFARWLFWIPFSYLWRSIIASGFAREQWLALPFCDRNFRFRVLYLAVRRPFEIMQAEFSPFVFACDWASVVYPDIPRITVEHNVEFQRIGSTYDLPHADVERMKEVEIGACRSCDRVIAVSQVDRELLIASGVEPFRMSVIPLGVDLAEFASVRPEEVRETRRMHGVRDDDFVILFHGMLHYRPNLAAVRLLAADIMPRLRAKGERVKCLIVGKKPPLELATDDIIMTGPVDRLSPYIHAADVAVVPLLDGGGTRLKIFEYFAAGVPVISTVKGAEGIKAEPGRDILLEDSMEGIARLVEELWRDPSRRRLIGENGRRFVETYGWDRLGVEYCRLHAEVVWSKTLHA